MLSDQIFAEMFVPCEKLSHAEAEYAKCLLYDAYLAIAAGAMTLEADDLNALTRVCGSAPETLPLWPSVRKTGAEDAGFVNGYLVRAADWGDSMRLNGAVAGHPSDVIAAILAMCTGSDVSGEKILELILLSYRLTWLLFKDMQAGIEGIDATSSLSLLIPVLAGVCRGDTAKQIENALCVSAAGGVVTEQVRVGAVTNIKSGATGYAIARAMACCRYSRFLKASETIFTGKYGWFRKVAGSEKEPPEPLPWGEGCLRASV
ncbi:MAG: MmgE/PrpD family protein [Lachnospiraceae bacterium]|nr:MmgE/PrpD family protein [Lachnospiraceae bacterium]